MLNYNEILGKKFIVYEGQPFEVLDARIFRMQQRKPVNQTKLKNLFTGKVTEVTFHQADKVDEAEIASREIKYLYANRGQFWFCEANEPSKRFSLTADVIGDGGRFLKPNSLIEVLPGRGPEEGGGRWIPLNSLSRLTLQLLKRRQRSAAIRRREEERRL